MKILYVIGKSQYDSTAIFMQEMAAHMTERGWDVSILDGRDALMYGKHRETVCSEQFDVIFTVNGMLLEEESTLGRDLLRDGHVIYCTYLMDHPMIHVERLQNIYPRIFVLSPDRSHVRYTDRYLSHIWGTAFLPHAGCAGAVCKPYEERTIGVSFMGSYVPPDMIRAGYEEYPAPMRELLNAVSKLLIQQNDLTLEAAVTNCLQKQAVQVPDEQMAQVISEFRIVDRFIRSYYRDQVIRTLVEAGITVDVYGDGWEHFICCNQTGLVVHPAVPYEESLNIIGDSKIALNCMPWFKDGSHDRVFTAMLCGAVCLTDSSIWLEEQLQGTKQVVFYSLKGLQYLPAKVRRILKNPEQAAQIAEQGRQLALERHTWADRAEEVMEYLTQLANLDMSCEELTEQEETREIITGMHETANAEDIETIRRDVIIPNTDLLHTMTRAVQYIRRQEYLYAMRETTAVIDQLETRIPVWMRYREWINAAGVILEETSLLVTLQELLEAQQREDYILLADLMELRLKPFVQSIQERYAGAGVVIEPMGERYRVELTSSGEYTLAARSDAGWIYLHSNGDPYQEGRTLAASWFDGKRYDYVVYGLGLGYHVAGLLELDEAVRVKVLEPEASVIAAAHRYGCLLPWEHSGRLEIVEDPQLEELIQTAQHMEDTARFVLHYPSMKLLAQTPYREWLTRYFIEYSSAQTQLPRLQGNFIRNQPYFGKEISELRDRFQGKTVYIIAAGPSLDRNMDELRRVGKDSLILATGTVLKKLLAADIVPDYVMIIDGGAGTFRQTEGLTERNVPLLYLPTVYHRLLAEYPGERYLVCQSGFEASEQYAREQGYSLYETGGSVTTAALDVCIRLGCRRIIFVGLDLAYTGQKDHAAGTASVRKVVQGNLQVEGVSGELVETARNLDIYRRWIENRLTRKDAKAVECIDATEGGARIQGTILRRLSDVVE